MDNNIKNTTHDTVNSRHADTFSPLSKAITSLTERFRQAKKMYTLANAVASWLAFRMTKLSSLLKLNPLTTKFAKNLNPIASTLTKIKDRIPRKHTGMHTSINFVQEQMRAMKSTLSLIEHTPRSVIYNRAAKQTSLLRPHILSLCKRLQLLSKTKLGDDFESHMHGLLSELQFTVTLLSIQSKLLLAKQMSRNLTIAGFHDTNKLSNTVDALVQYVVDTKTSYTNVSTQELMTLERISNEELLNISSSHAENTHQGDSTFDVTYKLARSILSTNQKELLDQELSKLSNESSK